MKNIQKQAPEKLKQNREALIASFLKGKETNFLKNHSRMLDDYFQESNKESSIGAHITATMNPYSIIALGGYGREEQCIHSDADVLFLFQKTVPDEAEELIREILYPLWDIGYHVGHSTRSLDECVEISDKDVEVLTSLLDARFICGREPLYSEFMKRFRGKIIFAQTDKLIHRLIDTNKNRHIHFGDSTYLLEPNLKEGQGGLRDYHTILWIARIQSGIKQTRELEYYGYLSHYEFHELTESLNFIWHVRNWLHHLTGKKYDQLHFRHQEKMAEILNFKEKDGQQPVEIFLGRLHGKMDFLKQQYLMFLYDLETHKRIISENQFIGQDEQTDVKGLDVQRCGLKFISPEVILQSPILLIKIFEESSRLQYPLSVEAKRLIKDFLYLVDDKFRITPEAIRSFERILATPTFEFSILGEMLNTGFLLKFIPEMNEIVNRIQYDEYHLYPVDKHSLFTVHTIKRFGTFKDFTSDSFCGNLYQRLSNKNLLLWAALLHDIGKGKPGGNHSEKGVSIARQILAEKGYSPEDIETVSFLILEHLFLIRIATRRDIQDEETAIICAKKIRYTERLKMLYLLTVADSISTGPKAWNNWISSLLKELFIKVLSTLKSGELVTHEAVESVEKKKAEILDSLNIPDEKEYMESLFNVMSPRYLLYTSAPDIMEHVSLYKRLGDAYMVWEVSKIPGLNTRKVTICAKDKPGLFSKIAGVFTLNNIDILDAQVYTWQNHIALDVFKVKPPPDPIFEDEKWDRTLKHLISALSEDIDLSMAISKKIAANSKLGYISYSAFRIPSVPRPHHILIDNNSSSFFTIIEVTTYDAPGLLFKITDSLFNLNLDVWLAKIATNIDQVVDVFYVRDLDGQKADSPEQVSSIKETIEKVLPG